MTAKEAASATVSVLSGMTREQRHELAKILVSDGLDRETRPPAVRSVVVRAVNEQASRKAVKDPPKRDASWLSDLLGMGAMPR